MDLNQEHGSNKYPTCIYLWIQIKPVFYGQFLDPDKCPDLRESCVKRTYKILYNLIHKLHNLKQILYFDIIQFTNNTFKILIHIKLCL